MTTNRRGFVTGAAALGAATLAAPAVFAQRAKEAAPAPATTKPLPTRGHFVIRAAHVMTMDPQLGDLKAGDIHVRDGEIIEVGTNLAAKGATVINGRDMIVLPGLVDTHTHLWTTQMRGRFGDTKETTYFPTRNFLANGYQVEDMVRGTRLGAAESLHSGITTLVDFCHNIRSAEMAEGCIRALRETGVRARYLYGAATTSKPTDQIDLAHLEKLATNWSQQAGDSPVTLGLGWRGPLGITTIVGEQAPPALNVSRGELEAARRLKLPISVHVSGQTAMAQFTSLAAGKFLGPDMQLVHFTGATPEQLRIAREAGCTVSLTPLTELRVGYGITPLGDYLASGIKTGLGIDSNSLAGVSDLFAVMKLFQGIEAGRSKNELAITARRLLELATIEGATSIGMGDKIGSLKPGKRADLIMIDPRAVNMGLFADDPAHLLVEAAHPSNVDTVIVDGRILKRNGRLTAIDGTRAVADAKASIGNILGRIK